MTTTASVPAAFAITPVNLKRLAISIHQPIFWSRPEGPQYLRARRRARRGRSTCATYPRASAVGSAEAVPHGGDIPLPRSVRGAREAGGCKGRRHSEAVAGGGYRHPRRQLSRERPRRLPERQLPGRGLRPEGGAGDGRLVSAENWCSPSWAPPSLHRHRTPERHGASRGLPPRAEGPCRPDWSPVLLLAGPKAGYLYGG